MDSLGSLDKISTHSVGVRPEVELGQRVLKIAVILPVAYPCLHMDGDMTPQRVVKRVMIALSFPLAEVGQYFPPCRHV